MSPEIKFRSSQEFNDEDDELINPDKSQKPEESTDESLSEKEENSEAIDLLNDPENETSLLEKDLDESEGIDLLSAEELDKLLSEFSLNIEEKGAESAGLVEESEALVNEQLAELSGSEAEIIPIKMELESASNELLGVTSDAYEEFEVKRAQIVADNQKRAQELRTKWNTEEPKPIEGLAKLSKIEEELKNKSESKTKENVVPELKTESPIEDAEELKVVTVEINPVDPEPLNFDLFTEDTEVVMENPADSEIKEDISLRSKKNVGAFKKMGQEAKRVFADLTFKYYGKKEIHKGQKFIEMADDKIHILNKDIVRSDDKIEEFKDKLLNIDELMGKLGDDIKPKEARAIEKSRKDLESKIKETEKAKVLLAEKLKSEEENKSLFEKKLAASISKFETAIDSKLEPYKQEIAKLETNRVSLVEEKENFETVISDFEGRLESLKNQISGLNETDMPAAAKKSFKAALTRKIKGIEDALAVSQKSVTKIEDSIVRINGRLNKEDEKISKWNDIRSDLQEVANKKLEKDRAEIGPGYTRLARPLEFEDSTENPPFSPEDYLAKWNSFSKNDGMALDVKTILASKGELNLKRLESIVKTTRFKGLSERQLKKKIKDKTDLLRAYFGVH